MHRRIATALRSPLQDLAKRLSDPEILRIRQQLGHRWRDCVLTPAAVVHWFLFQVLHGNTALGEEERRQEPFLPLILSALFGS